MKKILLITLAAVVVLSALGIAFLATLSRLSPPPGTYAGSLDVEPADYRPVWYRGVHTTKSFFLILNVTFHNTGTLDVNFNRSSWAILDPYGSFLESPSDLFGSSLSIPAERSAGGAIVFDINYWESRLAKLSTTLPDGSKMAVSLTTSLQVVVPGVWLSGDGTNWTLVVQGTPLALPLPGMNLTIRSSTGTVLLAPKSLVSLTYPLDRVTFTYSNSSWLTSSDRLYVSTLKYPNGSQLEMSIDVKVWFTTTLQG